MTTTITPSRILLIRPSALGDVCRTVPVAASLRQAFPDVTLDWIVQDEFRAAVASHPAVTEIISFPRRDFARWWRDPSTAAAAWGWLRSIRRRRYDLIIDCQGLSRSGLITRFAGAPVRIGRRSAREFAWLAYTHAHGPRRGGQRHTVDEMLALLEPIGVTPVPDPRLYISEDDRRWWRDEQIRLGMVHERYALLAPTARWISKRWPIERWRGLFAPLLQRGFDRIILIAAPNERAQLAPLIPKGKVDPRESSVIDLAGRTTIGQTMAMIAGAGLVVANDSAPLHMAVGFDRPCVGLFGPTDPAIVGPYRRPEAALRLFTPRPGEIINYRDPKLGDRLMRVISTSAVIQRIDRVCNMAEQNDEAAADAKGETSRDDDGRVRNGATAP